MKAIEMNQFGKSDVFNLKHLDKPIPQEGHSFLETGHVKGKLVMTIA